MTFKIKENLKSFVIGSVVTGLGLIGMLGFFLTNGVPGYSLQNSLAVFFAILAFVLPAAYTCCIALFGSENVISAVLGVATIVISVVLFGTVISGRILTIAAVFSYDAGNPVAWRAIYFAIVAIVGLLLSSIGMIVAGFVGKKK